MSCVKCEGKPRNSHGYIACPCNSRADDNDARRATVLDAAMSIAERNGYQWVTREDVAKLAGVSTATVSNAFGTMIGLKRAVLTEAVRRPVLAVVAQGLADKHPIVLAAPEHVRKEALATLQV